MAGAAVIRGAVPIFGHAAPLLHETIGDLRDLGALDGSDRVGLVFPTPAPSAASTGRRAP